MNLGDLTIAAAPLLPWPVVGALAGVALLVVVLAWWARARGAAWRTVAALGLLLALVNPSAVIEERQMLPDVAVVVTDESPSMAIAERRARAAAGVEQLRSRLAAQKDLEVRFVRGGSGAGLAADGTKLFEAVDRALGDIPRSRLAGVVLVTDGQVHDAPGSPGGSRALDKDSLPTPIHVLLAGNRNEGDRRLVVEQAPSYGIVGKPLSLSLKIDDGPGFPGGTGTAAVSVRRDGKEAQTLRLPTGTTQPFEFTLDHGGPTIFELSVEPGPRELTLENNRVVVVVNGVRDRLRVLLVTGEPHPGERAWRNLLKSDPAVDLIHFTILRPPEAQDFTPVNELSLIAFPIRELFEVRLNEFDLVIFDRYRRRDTLASVYLDNIVRYVRNGGGLLLAVPPNFGTPGSLFNSPLGQILPGAPTGAVLEQPFRPMVTDLGRRHPVTADLPGAESAEPEWGRWFRQVDAEARRGNTLMSGPSGRPLLLLDRVGEGRVAQFMSDHIWLWARGFEGGGPQVEMLRRIAHWLMKEPELEENDLRATLRANRVEIQRRSLEPDNRPVEVTLPSGAKQTITLTEGRGGRSSATFQAEEPGLYHVTDGQRVSLVAVGALNPLELADVRTTEEALQPVVNATGGRIHWLVDGPPELRRVRVDRDGTSRDMGGRGWIGLRANGDYLVTGVAQFPLLPGLALFLLALGALLLAWRREGR